HGGGQTRDQAVGIGQQRGQQVFEVHLLVALAHGSRLGLLDGLLGLAGEALRIHGAQWARGWKLDRAASCSMSSRSRSVKLSGMTMRSSAMRSPGSWLVPGQPFSRRRIL